MNILKSIEWFVGKVEDYFVEGMKFVQKDILPIAQLAALAIPGVPSNVTMIISVLPVLMTSVEEIFGDGSGVAKLGAVKAAVKSICIVEGVGSNEVWNKIEPIVDVFIHDAIQEINKGRKWKEELKL